ncbi:MAG: hypothetical protein LUD19_02015 [Clostridia bacterium]|nr:hypothetical protein [Clostridia bacterium]
MMLEIVAMIAALAVLVGAVSKWVDGIDESADSDERREHGSDGDYWDFP